MLSNKFMDCSFKIITTIFTRSEFPLNWLGSGSDTNAWATLGHKISVVRTRVAKVSSYREYDTPFAALSVK